MKRNILKFGSFLFAAVLLTGCEEDTVTYNGADFVTLQNTATTTISVTENVGTVTIPVDITYAQSSDVTVSYTITSDDAVAGVNYNILTPTIVIPAGATTANFQIQIVNDDEFNLARSIDFQITETSTGIAAGLATDEGSFKKTISISNDDYDCPTQFNYWLGDLAVDANGTDLEATGAGGASCDILYVNGDLANWGTTATHAISFTSDGGDGETGTVEVSQKIESAYELSDGTVVDVWYNGEGIYDVTTGEITIEYSVDAYQGTTNLGYFETGTTVITLAE